MNNFIDEKIEEFRKTRFAKKGGSLFDGGTYEFMYIELERFIRQALEEQRTEILKETLDCSKKYNHNGHCNSCTGVNRHENYCPYKKYDHNTTN